MTIFYGNTKEVANFFQTIPTYEEEKNLYYQGFELMQPHFFLEDALYEEGCQYLLYLNSQEEPIGVLKWKRYSLPNHYYVPEHEADSLDSYNAIRLLDVKQSERQKGVALALVRAFSERLELDGYIVGGKATPSGEQANIHSWIERECEQTYYESEIDLVEEWEEEDFDF